MNQILNTNENNLFYENFILKNKKKRKKYLIAFLFSISICIVLIIYLFCSFIFKGNEQKRANILKSNYNVSTLYNNTNENYNALKLSNDISIIGLIDIPKINISYPILSNSSKDLLKISVCRFAGPFPNRIGNMCIAGHNYKNSMMFSKLYKLNKNDSIYITDLNNVKLEYIVYDKLKVKENNLSCITNTSDIQLTLITCNDNNNSERIVIKAKVKE